MNQFNLIQNVAIYAIPILFGIIVHEVAHGWVASKCGDQTARLQGRLTLNPLPHIDILGTIVLPILFLAMGGFVFGWAKPVPVEARNMRNPRWNMLVVSAAGPVSNILMAILWAYLVRFSAGMNAWFGPPLYFMGQAGIMINIFLAVLNFFPVPPLDGGRMLCCLLPPRLGWRYSRLEPYGFFILVLLIATGILGSILRPLVMLMRYLVMGVTGI